MSVQAFWIASTDAKHFPFMAKCSFLNRWKSQEAISDECGELLMVKMRFLVKNQSQEWIDEMVHYHAISASFLLCGIQSQFGEFHAANTAKRPT